LLKRLEFGSSDVYAPQGRGAISIRSKGRVAALKAGKDYAVSHYARRAERLAREGEFEDFFGARVTLVPVCRSSPVVQGGLWVPMLLAQAMQRLGMAREVSPLLKRISEVPKSAFQKAENRPTAQKHFDSMRADILNPAPTRIVLIDDVVTRGTTLLAAASRIAEAYPGVQVRAFACVRTMSGQEIEDFEVPCVGWIEPAGKWTYREP
jgi:phosphoribosylpyrophosphate synthetase